MQTDGSAGARPRPGDEVSLRIDRLAYGGEGVGRLDGFVVFAERTVPEDRVRARILRVLRRHAEAEVLAVESPAPERVPPRCPHFLEGCGGCSWQHVSYEGQRRAKAALVRDSLERLGGFSDPPLRPFIAAPRAWYYRNKMDFAFHPEAGLGLHLRGSWEQVFSLETCFLQSELSVAIVKAARAFVRQAGISLFDPRARQGFLRALVIRQSEGTGEVMVGVITSPGPFPEGLALAARLTTLDPRIGSVVRGVRSNPSEGAGLESIDVLAGTATITEVVRGLRFRIGLGTFFQTNTQQAETLIDVVRELAGPTEDALVLDVYCGVGLFTLALAGAARQVIGVEMVAASVEAARENAALNGMSNVDFSPGDARHALADIISRHGAPRVVVLDPPRAGAGGKVMRRIARAEPERIVYVSCNPTTLARDLQELVPFGYRLTAVQPVDLFPQTYHVETVVALERAR